MKVKGFEKIEDFVEVKDFEKFNDFVKFDKLGNFKNLYKNAWIFKNLDESLSIHFLSNFISFQIGLLERKFMQIVKFSGNFCEFLAKSIILAVILMMAVLLEENLWIFLKFYVKFY